MSELKAQNSELLRLLFPITQDRSGRPDGLAHVKIENANMPFWALVGLILKITFASIPAFIVIFILSLLFMGIIAAMGILPALLFGLSQWN